MQILEKSENLKKITPQFFQKFFGQENVTKNKQINRAQNSLNNNKQYLKTYNTNKNKNKNNK